MEGFSSIQYSTWNSRNNERKNKLPIITLEEISLQYDQLHGRYQSVSNCFQVWEYLVKYMCSKSSQSNNSQKSLQIGLSSWQTTTQQHFKSILFIKHSNSCLLARVPWFLSLAWTACGFLNHCRLWIFVLNTSPAAFVTFFRTFCMYIFRLDSASKVLGTWYLALCFGD